MTACDFYVGRVLLVVLTVFLASTSACGGGSAPTLVINGTWVSNDQPAARGRFVMTTYSDMSAYDGPLSGSLRFFDGNGVKVADEAVTGTIEEQIQTGASSYWTIDFATADGTLSFFTAATNGHKSTSQMIGSFTNSRGSATVQGSWHNNPAGGPADCVIDEAFYQTGYTFKDLAWNGSNLVAVATPANGAAGVYEIDTSQSPPIFNLVNLTPTPASPTGIAWDGANYWIVDAGTASQATIYSYDASWANLLPGSVTVTAPLGNLAPVWISFWDNYLWYAPLLNSGIFQIAPATGQVTMIPSIQLDRPDGADSDGTSIWSASFPPGGIWAAIYDYDKTGNLLKAVYSPENKPVEASTVACEGSNFFWVTCGQNLYRLDAH